MRASKLIALSACTSSFVGLGAAAAWAHTGLGAAGGLAAGLLHPLSGLDHLAVMLAIGLWAGQLGGRARLALPLSFFGLIAAGMALAAALPALAVSEVAVLATVVALGLLVGLELRLSAALAALLVGGFALIHGHAHGAEVPASASGLAYGAGVLAATALLLGGGLALRAVLGRAAARGAGFVTLAVGGVLAAIA